MKKNKKNYSSPQVEEIDAVLLNVLCASGKNFVEDIQDTDYDIIDF